MKRKTHTQSEFPIARTKNIVVQDTETEVLIYDLEANKAHSLNETSALVWKKCDGTKSVLKIVSEISSNTKTQVSENLVWLALSQLSEAGLLKDASIDIEKFENLSRREAIRKIGITSMVSLPIIATIVAPTATAAQSLCPPICIAPGQNICAGCAAMPITFDTLASTDGTCSGAVISNSSIVCPSSGSINNPNRDVRRL